MTIKELTKAIEGKKPNSAWSRGVQEYALELVEQVEENRMYTQEKDMTVYPKMIERELLNGAQDWHQYSWGGCSLIYDKQIAARLCTLTELKKTHNGERKPNSREEWLDVQARALYQASQMILRIASAE